MRSKKDEIINHATTLFMTQGFLATSTRQIARELGITQPAIYHHFKNKEDIYVHVLTKFTKEIGTNLNLFLAEDTSPEVTLNNMSNYLIENHSMNFSLMMKDMDEELPEDVKRKIFIMWNTNYFQPFETFFERQQPNLSVNISSRDISLHFLRILSAYTDKNINKKNQLPIEELIHIFFFGIFKE